MCRKYSQEKKKKKKKNNNNNNNNNKARNSNVHLDNCLNNIFPACLLACLLGLIFDDENEASAFLRKVGKLLQKYTVSRPNRWSSSSSSIKKALPHISLVFPGKHWNASFQINGREWIGRGGPAFCYSISAYQV
jgi:hypothetical protein